MTQAAVIGGERLVVPDVLRGVALFAMLVAHAKPFLVDLPGAVTFAMGSLNDLASPLFALVMGLSAQTLLPARGAAHAARVPPRPDAVGDGGRRSARLRGAASAGEARRCRAVRIGDYPDTLHDVGLVFAVYVAVVLLATVRAPGAARVIAAIFEPFRARRRGRAQPVSAPRRPARVLAAAGLRVRRGRLARWSAIVVGVFVVAWVWWRFIGAGPVEWLLGWVTGRPKRFRRALTPA